MIPVGSFAIPPEHPCLPGHFPGQPIVPGVLLLDYAMLAILRIHPGQRVAGLPTVKFTRPVLPDQDVDVTCTPARNGKVGFACTVDGHEVARGALLLQPE